VTQVRDDLLLVGVIGIPDTQLEEEAVELGFGERKRAFELNRILGCQHQEGPR